MEEINESKNPKSSIIPNSETETSQRYLDVYEEKSPNELEKWSINGNKFLFQSENGMSLKISIRNSKVIRFHYSSNGLFQHDFSYAVIPAKEKYTSEISSGETENAVYFQTEDLIIEVWKENLQLKIWDNEGQKLLEEAAPFYVRSTILKGITDVKTTLLAAEKEHYFGLGDKSSDLDLRGKAFENWNSDSFGYNEETDPLYRAIPFYYSLNEGKSYGIFLDNSYRSHFDFDSKKNGKTSFSAKGGEMNFYFIYGEKLDHVASQYMNLTGKPEMPPLWSLGFHQCRWSYHPETRVKEVAQEFRDRQIPCDAIYLDIDYMDGYRCFTWNKEKFPDPKQMISDLEEIGFQTVVMIDPGLRVDKDYYPYSDGLKKNMFCRRTTGDLMVGPVWPQACVFPEYTRPDVREWWGNLYEDIYNEKGVSGFWNDMNEPAVFKVTIGTFPDEVNHNYEGNPTNHAKAHNVYGMQMSRATQEGLKRLNPNKRPFLVSRATFSGGQRYAALWTGDNVANWEHLEIANRQCQRLSISGFAFVGTDIGGFVDQPDGELLVRWLQLGIFHPFYRIHSSGNNLDGAAEAEADKIEEEEKTNRKDQEPWAFGDEFTPYAKSAIELRYKLLPYIYSAFRKHIVTGVPLQKSLAFYDQNDENAIKNESGFLFGDHILAYPVTKSNTKEIEVYLPKGKWINYFHGTILEGNQTIRYNVKLDYSPIFVKVGAIIPHYPIQQYTNEKPIEELILKVYIGEGKAHSELYEDAGDDYSFLNGNYSLRNFETEGNKDFFKIKQTREGNRESSYSNIRIEFFGLEKEPKRIYANGDNIRFESIENKGFMIQIKPNFQNIEVKLN